MQYCINIAFSSFLDKFLVKIFALRPVMSNPLGTDLPLVSDPRSEERGQFDTMNANFISALSALAGAVIGGVIR